MPHCIRVCRVARALARATWVAGFLALVLPAGTGWAQNIGQTTGTLTGVVRDQTKLPLPGVTVTITSPALIGDKVIVTQADGSYRVPGLPRGAYRIQAELQGFITAVAEDVELNIGSTLGINFELKAGVAETVEVTATKVVDMVSVEPAYDISAEQVASLPKERSWESMIEVTPGVTRVRQSTAEGLSFQGGSVSDNTYIIDGVDTTNTVTAARGQDLIFEFVDNIQVKSGFLGAEYGGALGGLVNVTSKSGSNQFKGTANVEFRSSGTTGGPRQRVRVRPTDSTQYDWVQDPEDPFKQFDVGGTLGGPLLRDRLWFFGGYVPQLVDTTRTVTFLNGTVKAYDQDVRRHFYMGKLSYRPTGSVLMNGSFSYSPYSVRGTLPSHDGVDDPTADFSVLGNVEDKGSASLNVTWTASPHIFVEAFAGYYMRQAHNTGIPVADYVAFDTSNLTMAGIPAEFQGPAGFKSGPYTLAYSKDDQQRLNLGLNVTGAFSAWGSHTLKVGFQHAVPKSELIYGFTADRMSMVWNGSFLGQRGTYGYYKNYDIGTSGDVTSNNSAFYVQDSWSPVPRWTLNLGLRVERESLTPLVKAGTPAPEIGFSAGEKVAPRLGVAWDVRGDGRWKLFANAGSFYDMLKHSLPRDGFGGGRFRVDYYTLDTYDWKALDGKNPSGRLLYTVDASGSSPTVDPDMLPTRVDEFAVGTELQIGQTMSAGIQYMRRSIKHGIDGFQANISETPRVTVNVIGNAGRGMVAALPSPVPWREFTRDYNGLEFRLTKRLRDNWSGSVSYTFSRLFGNYDGLAQSILGPSPNQGSYCQAVEGCYTSQGTADEGLLPGDVPHEFKLNGSYQLPLSLTLGGAFRAKSGTPISRALGVNQATLTYPEGRLSDGRTDFLTQLDLFLQWGFTLRGRTRATLSVNLLNVFDQDASLQVYKYMLLGGSSVIVVPRDVYFAGYDYQSYIDAQRVPRDPTFLQPSLFQFPRELRFGVRIDF